MTFRRTMLGVAALALAAPWIFLGIAETWTTSIWDSGAAARTQATQITRVLLYASMIVVPVAASAYGAMAARWRIWKGAIGGVVGMALWLANFSCLEAVFTSGS